MSSVKPVAYALREKMGWERGDSEYRTCMCLVDLLTLNGAMSDAHT